MNDRDKARALYLNLTMIMNALEELESLRCSGDENTYGVSGDSGAVLWDRDTKTWELRED